MYLSAKIHTGTHKKLSLPLSDAVIFPTQCIREMLSVKDWCDKEHPYTTVVGTLSHTNTHKHIYKHTGFIP